MSGEKNQAATPERLRKVRRDGDVPRSRALAALGGLVGGGVTLLAMDLGAWRALTTATLRLELQQPLAAWTSFGVRVFAPVAGAATLGALAGALALGGLVWAPGALRLRPERLNPSKGLQRMVEPKVWADGARDLGWLGAVTLSVFLVARQPGLLSQPRLALGMTWGAVLVIGLPWAILDGLWTRRAHARRHRMSHQDVKEEAKRREGDPQAKQQRRQEGQRLMQEPLHKRVASAAVLLVNPRHVAVALAFDPSLPDPPWVVARGRDAAAARLRALARQAGVPIVRNVRLARRLHRLEEEEPIPEALYGAVAAVLCRLLTDRGAG